ncbi:hypothetical protein BSLG_001357 [Batrachochytrium salamandrivorans]|nr:hypothetical protein BASA83_000447 [Batrachochytrium salamandrivorans]KAJ1344217.1 hypothetical protein BSLG_001357 [Batrachochytrium salamandrivorans]
MMLTVAEARRLKVADLKSELTKLGLPCVGKKEDLLTRLVQHLEGNAVSSSSPAATAPSVPIATLPVHSLPEAINTSASKGTGAASHSATSVQSADATIVTTTTTAQLVAIKSPTSATQNINLATTAKMTAEERQRLRAERFGVVADMGRTVKADVAVVPTPTPKATIPIANTPVKATVALDPSVDVETLARRQQRFGIVPALRDTKAQPAAASVVTATHPEATQKSSGINSAEEIKRQKRLERFQQGKQDAAKRAKVV